VTSLEKILIVLLVVSILVAPVAVLTIRYRRYEERRARGHRSQKPVWKPFWIE
jgi:cell division protein FtsL